MSNNNTFRATRYLPQAVVATASVVVLPVLVVWLLLADGVVSSPWVGAGLAIVLSSMASVLGSAYWKRRSGPGDVLFSELLLWGWVHRLRSERRLANAIGLLARGRSEDTDESIERRSQLLTQIAAALDAHDSYTDGHSRRVALHAAMIARKMGLSQEDVAKVSTAAAVHDVGKLRIPIEVLNKHDRLTAEEFEIVKRHADEGAEIVSCLEDRAITEMVRHHHERFDGTGYPAGLGGGQIPIGARIIAVADTFDALTSERPYRSAVRHKTALEIIRVVSSMQLDPAAVRAFLKCYSGKRAVLFWTLLAVSPQRALAIVSGRSAGRAGIVPATSIAMPAALATLVVAAVGTAGQAARASVPLRFAQSQPVQLGVVLPLIRTEKRRTTAHASRSRTAPSRQALLGVTTTRTPTSTGPSSHARTSTGSGHVQSGPGQTVGGSPRPPVPRHGGTGTGTPNRGAGSKKPPSTGVGSHPPTRTTAPPSSSSPPPSSPAGGGNPGGGSPGGSGGGNPGGGSPGGSGGGNPGGGSTGGSGGGNPGGGSGGGGQPGSGPPTKQACFNGGWASHGFPNQGQCVAAFEHSLHG